jgi:hypothetical protein
MVSQARMQSSRVGGGDSAILYSCGRLRARETVKKPLRVGRGIQRVILSDSLFGVGFTEHARAKVPMLDVSGKALQDGWR